MTRYLTTYDLLQLLLGHRPLNTLNKVADCAKMKLNPMEVMRIMEEVTHQWALSKNGGKAHKKKLYYRSLGTRKRTTIADVCLYKHGTRPTKSWKLISQRMQLVILFWSPRVSGR